MRLVFMGTSEFALPSLKALNKKHEIVCVYTAPDKPAGRGMNLKKGAVKAYAEEAGVEVRTPVKLDNRETEYLKSLRPEAVAVISYGLKIPRAILDLPSHCVINAHASLLPRHRGASPINAAVIAGDKESGVTVFRLNEAWDAGEMISRKSVTLEPRETASSLWEKLRILSADAFLEALSLLDNNSADFEPQDESQVTYAHKISREDALIHWDKPAGTIDRMIRGYYSWPMAYTLFDNRTLKIHRAVPVGSEHNEKPGTVLSADKKGIVIACGKDALRLEKIQLQSKKAMECGDFLNGNNVEPGMLLGV